ncbi:MAG TPA: PAS domain S-box protein [Persephonella sp.]|uniref:PAS fold family protein n=1 Tax=Persephonella marina (strain DSM 14350 / EX-H1) TaxID=123214 RepID=C0QPW9_PERMH|nr:MULTISPECIES: PAS domain-containing protein [Persephonella]ACO04071.1 PAS fold family protein [Persephonella marina EX-H1]HCB69670.1 PAS domain S-box protein [Persephonella sp.]
MGRIRPKPINKESEFKPDEIFFSSTDLKGIILSGNDVFQRISKYSMDELIGSPHNIIRHPDMPKIVFKLLWDYIQSGKPIVAYVKNMAKDGSYYWVLATVMPVKDESGNIREYISIRIKPTTDYFKIIPQVYQELLEIEREGGMDASYKALTDTLKKLGYDSYDDFMKDILVAELKDKSSLLKIEIPSISKQLSKENVSYFNDIISKSKSLDKLIEELFNSISNFEKLRMLFSEKSESIYKVTDEIRLTALNSSVESLRLGSKGAVFSVISAEMRKNSEEESKIIKQMKVLIDKNTEEIKDIVFTLSLSKLEIIMFGKFLSSLVKTGSEDEIFSALKRDVANFFYLISSSHEYFHKLSDLVSKSIGSLEELNKRLRKLKLLIEELEAMYFRGLIESGHMEGTNFSIIFTYVRKLVNQTKENISALEEPLRNIFDDELKIKHNIRKINFNLEDIRVDLERILN